MASTVSTRPSKLGKSYNDEDKYEDDKNKGYFLKTQLNSKTIASGFWIYLIEEESTEMESMPVFRDSFDQFMDEVDDSRKLSLYERHEYCDNNTMHAPNLPAWTGD